MPVMQSSAEVAIAAADERNWLLWTAFKTGQVLLFVLSLALLVAALVLADRKIWAAVQMRRGPNVVGAFGLLQTIADALKFFFKEIVIPAGSDKFLFILAPVLGLVMAFAAWAVVPVAPGWVISDINIGVLYVLALSSLGVYGIIIGGWASNSKYPFMGALRSAAQMVSYEVSIGFIILTVIFLSGSMNLTTIVDSQGPGIFNWNMFLLNPFGEYGIKIFLIAPIMFYMGVLFFISALAETNRPPFDLPEAESELVAGYQVEYSSTPFLMFFFAEYVNTDDSIIDFRNGISPKAHKAFPDSNFTPYKYGQVFEAQNGFLPNLSILDLLFCTGPEASFILGKCVTTGE